jgi:DNA-directed RNA polymerase sigma subunit (sigma70/sigma32)
MKPKSREAMLRLAVFDTVRTPGRRYTILEIAQATGWSRALVWLIEKRAIEKMRRVARERGALNDNADREVCANL